MNRAQPAILILAKDAADYINALQDAGAGWLPLAAAQTVEEARLAYEGQHVMLAAPDLAAAVIDEFADVRWVQSTWAGIKPLLAASRRDYLLTGVQGVFGPAMAEYVLGHLLAHELKLRQRREAQGARRWLEEASGTLRGKTAGIMGTGSIGSHVARVLNGLGVRVHGYSLGGRPVQPFAQVYPGDRLEAFLSTLDYVISTLPHTNRTDGLLGPAALAALPAHAVLVNVGRGNVLDEAALADALNAGRLAGAVLDVFAEEPLPPGSPLWDATGATITAHVAARSVPGEIAPLFLDNYRRFCDGSPLSYLVDFERGY